MRRTVIAFIVTPLFPAVLFIHDAGWMAFPLAYLWTYALGLPAFALLKAIKHEGHLSYAIAGFVLGFGFVFIQGNVAAVDHRDAIMVGLIGAATAFGFSLIRGSRKAAAAKAKDR